VEEKLANILCQFKEKLVKGRIYRIVYSRSQGMNSMVENRSRRVKEEQ
jgi:hypothetical protein